MTFKGWLKWTVDKLKDTHGWWGQMPEQPKSGGSFTNGQFLPQRTLQQPSMGISTMAPAAGMPKATPGASAATRLPAAGAPTAGAVGPTWGMNSPDYWTYQTQLRKLGYLR